MKLVGSHRLHINQAQMQSIVAEWLTSHAGVFGTGAVTKVERDSDRNGPPDHFVVSIEETKEALK